MRQVRSGAPSWLRHQRYARDIITTPRRDPQARTDRRPRRPRRPRAMTSGKDPSGPPGPGKVREIASDILSVPPAHDSVGRAAPPTRPARRASAVAIGSRLSAPEPSESPQRNKNISLSRSAPATDYGTNEPVTRRGVTGSLRCHRQPRAASAWVTASASKLVGSNSVASSSPSHSSLWLCSEWAGSLITYTSSA
jgi:hypothetical protein